MRCDDVIRELANPTEGRDPIELAYHLAHCKVCARKADQSIRLEQIWEATRPSDPPAETWDRIWDRVRGRLEGLPDASHSRPPRWFRLSSRNVARARSWGTVAAIGIVGVSQAAAVMLAFGLSWKSPYSTPPTGVEIRRTDAPMVVQTLSPTGHDPTVEIDEGQVVLIKTEGSQIQVIDLSSGEPADNVDRWYLAFNDVESMANPVVAMAE